MFTYNLVSVNFLRGGFFFCVATAGCYDELGSGNAKLKITLSMNSCP